MGSPAPKARRGTHAALCASIIRAWRTAMKRSTDRILTTHAGRLDGPPDYREMVKTLQSGASFDAASFAPRVRAGMVDVIRKQAGAGIDIISNGELGNIGFGGIAYYGRRLSGLS